MRTLLIVYHSMTGGTRQTAEAAARGAASEPGLRVRLLAAEGLAERELLDAAPRRRTRRGAQARSRAVELAAALGDVSRVRPRRG